MVEIIVSFALIGIFMSAAAVVMAMFSETTLKMNSIHHSQMLSITLMDTIEGELSGAADTGSNAVQIQDGGHKIRFANKKGYILTMGCNDDGYLVLDYEGAAEGENVWEFGEGVYHDSRIQDITFEQADYAGGGAGNLIKVTLKLQDQKTGYVRTKERIVKCYDVAPEQIS